MKKIIASTIMLLFATSAFAQSYGVDSKVNGVHLRSGVSCSLSAGTHVNYTGFCTVGRKLDTTVIEAAGLEFGIVRDDDTDHVGTLYIINGDEQTRLGRVYADGNCWVGDSFKFCAL